MFEQSMVISQESCVSTGARWTWAGSVTLQCCAAALLIAVPLLHPQRLTLLPSVPQLVVPLRTVEPLRSQKQLAKAAPSARRSFDIPAVSLQAISAPTTIPHQINAGDPPLVSVADSLRGMGAPLPGVLASISKVASRVAVSAPPHSLARGPMRVSSGVGTGMLTEPIRPIYPQIAKTAKFRESS